ncbi:coiled-coil domain-containing protein 171-like [Silurus asotus]|uniref:Coiled-coil domain-containing protein 171-like n=1 Tax=Silurus asotus TaxID=30991 RepID=A0AAD5FAW6_SILAS|nr:coiled-coil domain-containing protein 171-like [Silurus asotus]
MSERRPMQRGGDGGRERARRRDGGQSKASLRASQPRPITRSSQGDLKDISSLREVIGQLPAEGRTFDKEEELRWKINQLEKDKLELNSKYNQEVSGFEAQLTRCRALLEKGEAQRQTLEYELAVVKRDAAAQNSRSEDKIADLIKHNQQLEGLSAELRQRGSDLQKALEITQQARYDDERSLQVDLRERDHLIHSISTERELLQEENTRLHTLLQEHKDTLQKLKDRMEGIQRDRERDTEELKIKTCELRKSMEREEELRTEVETVNKKVKALEKCVESERAAHMEFKVNAEVIQIRLRDMEAAQSVEKRNQAEVVSSLELLKHKFGEVERAHTQERERADNTQHTLTRVELEYQNTKANLIGQLEKAKAASSDRIGQLEREKAESAKLIGQLEKEKAELAKLIGHLEREKAESAKLIGQLEKEKAESAKLIGHLEREKAESAKLIGQLEREKAESVKLIGQLEKEKAESAKLSVRLQEQKRVQMEREHELNLVQKRLVFLEETYHGLLKELEQLLHHHHHQGASPISSTGDQRNHSTLMDILKRVLHRYHTELKDLVKVIDALNEENKDKDEIITDQRRRIQECEARCVCVSEEAERLRVYAAESADAAERMQRELENITHRWEEEKERHTQTKTHTHTLTQDHKKEHQEKLAFLHSLYQQLLTGGVLVASPQSMMGSFSWAELSIMLQEQADVLTSDLHSANQRITFLESVCEGKEAALTSVCEQLKQREETWIKQREELDTHHTHLINELHTRAQVHTHTHTHTPHTPDQQTTHQSLGTHGCVFICVCVCVCVFICVCVCVCDLQSRLDHTVKCLHGSERAHSILQQEVSRLQELVRVCRRDDASLLAACALLAGCVSSLRGRVCALLQQKAVLKRGVCDAQSLRQEVGALLRALADPGVQGQSKVTRGVWRFRVHVIGVMAALRLRTLCRNTHTLLRAAGGVCVSELRLSNTHTQEEEENQRVMKMLTSSQLCVILHSCMQELQTELQRTTESSVCVAAAARSSFTKLMEKVLPESEWGCYGDMGLLARQLGHGLNNLRKMHHVPLRHDSNKIMVSALQQHFLEFTQRLHNAEVERRDLRIKLSHIKRRNTHTEIKDSTHTASVSLAQFRGVCEELSSALRREQQAQTLLHEQATQLQELGITMETHTSEQLEKDHTLAQAVQSLADAKAELKKKDQTLRLLGKRLNQSQQEKQELQQVTNRAENTLYMAARSKECVLSYLVSVERRMKELKDQLLLSHSTFSRDDLTLHFPTMHQDTQDLQLDGEGGAEMKACQLIRPTETPPPLSESEGNQEMPALTHTGVTDVPRGAHTLQKKSTVPLKKSRGVKKSTRIKYASKSSTEKP